MIHLAALIVSFVIIVLALQAAGALLMVLCAMIAAPFRWLFLMDHPAKYLPTRSSPPMAHVPEWKQREDHCFEMARRRARGEL